MRFVACGCMVVLLSTMASADIIEWQDQAGVTHYTNVKGEVPTEYRESAQVVVDEAARGLPRPPAPVEAAPGSHTVQESVPPARQAEAVYDHSPVVRAYVSGWWQGRDAASAMAGSEPEGVQITGPLAVAVASAPALVDGVDACVDPVVTTSFDRGRSRHRTLRMLLQDRFALERGYGCDHGLPEPWGTAWRPRVRPVVPCGWAPSYVPAARLVVR